MPNELNGSYGPSVKVTINKSLYCQKAVFTSAHKFTKQCNIKIEISEKDDYIIFFNSNHLRVEKLESISQEFCNELIEQQHKHDLNEDFGYLRDLIVEHAFSPINNIEQRLKDEK